MSQILVNMIYWPVDGKSLPTKTKEGDLCWQREFVGFQCVVACINSACTISLCNHTTFYVVINVCLPVSAERIDALAVRRIVDYCSITTATPTD